MAELNSPHAFRKTSGGRLQDEVETLKDLLIMKKKTKFKAFSICDPVYRCWWLVQIGGELQEAINEFAFQIKQEPWQVVYLPGRYAHFTAHRDTGKGGLIWVKEPVNKKENLTPYIAHEVYHAVTWLMECLEVPQSTSTEEVGAYYTEFLMRNILENLPK